MIHLFPQILKAGLDVRPAEDLQAAWQAAPEAGLAAVEDSPSPEAVAGLEQFLVLASCRDEQHQVELLQRLQGEGVKCKALLA